VVVVIGEGQMRQLLTLNKDGKLALRSGDGKETVIERRASNVLLLLDTSGSMAGAKLLQAKAGAVDFARSAGAKGYATALAVFADRAAIVCDPVADSALLARKIEKLKVGMVGGSTDLAAGLVLAAKFAQLAAVIVVTDGASNDNKAALDSAGTLKSRGVEIVCIGTDDADSAFLSILATRSDLATHVSAKHLRLAITNASRMLPRG
jgi:Mg-chelatase subunit ChlD